MPRFSKVLAVFFLSFVFSFVVAGRTFSTQAARVSPSPVLSPSPVPSPTSTPAPRTDITQQTQEVIGPLEMKLREQKLGSVLPFNPIKYSIRSAVSAGVPANTIVLLLLLPVIALAIAISRNIVGIRGFGIFLPAALAVVFVAIGPLVGIGLFLVIIAISLAFRFILRRLKVKLQYLPRMSLMLFFVVLGVLGVLFLAPILKFSDFGSVSIFPVLILVLLAEDFNRVQLGKSARTAVNLTVETLILAFFSFVLLSLKPLQVFALLNPEPLLITTLVLDFILGKYVGLRLLEYIRFRQLLKTR